MKKPAKTAKKAAPAKKHAAKSAKAPAKAVKKPAPKPAKAPAKKVVAKKPAAKVASKKAPAKVAAKKAPAKVAAKKAPAKVVAKKAPAKVQKPAPLSPKEKAKLQKQKAAEKAAALKLKEKLEKEKAKEKVKAKELAKKQKEEEKRLKQQQKVDAKAEKLRLKEEEKLKKQREKEDKKNGKKGQLSFEESQEEGTRPRGEEDEDDDFDSESPRQKKMIFDEVPDEEFIPVRKGKKSVLDEEIKDSLVEEILALSEDFSLEDIFTSIRNMELFKVESDECVVRGCDNPATTSGYCRYHYIKLWKDVKKKELILSEGKLAKMIEELIGKYPMKVIENLIQDLADDKAFSHVLKDLDIETDENELDGFDDDELLDDDQDIAFETKVTKPSFED